jgi:hypothetical protein
MRDESFTPTASGNGITFTQIHKITNVQNIGAHTVFRGMDSSPTTGSITVTHTGNGDTVSCIAVRFSGVDTSGTNGSGAVGNTATDTGPDPDDDDMLLSVTIDASDNFAVFSGYSRGATLSDPPASGETTILINSTFGTGGNRIRCHTWYQTGATGSVQGGAAANLSADNDHVESGVEVIAASGADYTLPLDAGGYTTTGKDAGTLAGRILSFNAGAYTLIGRDPGLLIGRLLDLDAGSYAVTGQAAALLVSRLIALDTGSYTVTGRDVTLTYNAVAGDYILNLDAGGYTLTGQDAGLIVSRLLDAGAGAYVLTGKDADILRGFLLSAETGAYTVTGQDAALVLARVLGLDAGSYAVNGQDVTLNYGGVVIQSYLVSLTANTSPAVVVLANVTPEEETEIEVA